MASRFRSWFQAAVGQQLQVQALSVLRVRDAPAAPAHAAAPRRAGHHRGGRRRRRRRRPASRPAGRPAGAAAAGEDGVRPDAVRVREVSVLEQQPQRLHLSQAVPPAACVGAPPLRPLSLLGRASPLARAASQGARASGDWDGDDDGDGRHPGGQRRRQPAVVAVEVGRVGRRERGGRGRHGAGEAARHRVQSDECRDHAGKASGRRRRRGGDAARVRGGRRRRPPGAQRVLPHAAPVCALPVRKRARGVPAPARGVPRRGRRAVRVPPLRLPHDDLEAARPTPGGALV